MFRTLLPLQKVTPHRTMPAHLDGCGLFFATVIQLTFLTHWINELVVKCCAPLVPWNACGYDGSSCSSSPPGWSFGAFIVYVCKRRLFFWTYTPTFLNASNEIVLQNVEAFFHFLSPLYTLELFILQIWKVSTYFLGFGLILTHTLLDTHTNVLRHTHMHALRVQATGRKL